jgi:hypothetical protein
MTMALLKLKGEKVVGIYFGISPSYVPKTDEVLVDNIPEIALSEGEYAHLYYRDGKIDVVKSTLNRV